MTRLHHLALAFAVAAAMSASATTPAGYAAHRTITFTGYEGTTPLTNFPVLVKLPASYFRTASRKDVAFTDSEGNRIPHEVDSFDANNVNVWVRVPELSGANTSITAYFGKGVVDVTAFTAADVWTNAYAAVWHLNADATDSTGHGLAQTVRNASHVSVVAAESSPLVGRSLKLDGNNEAGLLFDTPKSTFIDTCISDVSKITVTGWFKPAFEAPPDRDAARLFCWKVKHDSNTGFDTFQKNDGKLYVRGKSNAGDKTWTTTEGLPWTVGAWSHIAISFNETAFAAFLNGSDLAGSGGTSAVTVDDSSKMEMLGFGNMGGYQDGTVEYYGYQYPFANGQLDELRIYNGVASADWIKAEHDTVAVASFATYGEIVEAVPANATWISSAATAEWSDPANWHAGVLPFGDDAVVTFASPAGTSAQTIVMDGSVVVSSIVQSDSVSRTISLGSIAFSSPASVTVAANGGLWLEGAVVTNGISKSGLGTFGLSLDASAGNSFTGTVSVAEGTLSLLPPVEVAAPSLVTEGGFEPDDALTQYSGQGNRDRRSNNTNYFADNLTSWSFAPTSNAGSGICCNDSYFSNNGQISQNGSGNAHAAFLRKSSSVGPGTISREVVTEVDNAAVTVEFQFNTRWYTGTGAADYWYAKIGVLFDGVEIGSTDSIRSPHKNSGSGDQSFKDWRTCSVTFHVPTAGTHTLSFVALTPNYDNVDRDCEALIDNVKVGMARAVSSEPVRFGKLTLDIADGAKLRLSDGVDLKVKEIWYNGVKLSGSVTAETHPEFVAGSGRVRCGGGLVVVCH